MSGIMKWREDLKGLVRQIIWTYFFAIKKNSRMEGIERLDVFSVGLSIPASILAMHIFSKGPFLVSARKESQISFQSLILMMIDAQPQKYVSTKGLIKDRGKVDKK